MMCPFWSLLLCLVLICGLQLAICHNYIHDAYISLHITHIIIIQYVYIVILIFIYRIFVNTAMRQTTSFEAL